MPKKNGDKYDHMVKVLLLGDSSVGKSSLLLRFCEKRFDSSYKLTIGIDFKTRIVENGGKRYKLQIWDTAGQERFRTITPAYFRSAMGVILVYDVTNVESFESLGYWTGVLDEYSRSDLVKVVVGNKLDLSLARQVSEQKGRSFAEQIGAPFFEVSAKNNHLNMVDGPFMMIIEQLTNSGHFFPFLDDLNSKRKKRRKFVLLRSHDSDFCALKYSNNSEEANSAGDDIYSCNSDDNENQDGEDGGKKQKEADKRDEKRRNKKKVKEKQRERRCSDENNSFSSIDEDYYERSLNSRYQKCC
ncbi:Ras family protein SEC4 [Cryptosporidium ryanae]|uniref:Ras family protein SEC4 n=1 Tax=Cryptosporidium ryanae TaxID=515981 RepID=UPI00351A1C1B|nr:Ras family protein SEC4 [Cryptosporidium ryanae]